MMLSGMSMPNGPLMVMDVSIVWSMGRIVLMGTCSVLSSTTSVEIGITSLIGTSKRIVELSN